MVTVRIMSALVIVCNKCVNHTIEWVFCLYTFEHLVPFCLHKASNFYVKTLMVFRCTAI